MRTKILAIIVLAIMIVAALGLYLVSKPAPLSVLVAASTNVGTAGSPITFTVMLTPSSASISTVLWNFGDGVNQTASGATTTHTFANGGRYLILAQVTATYQSFLFPSSVMASNSMALFPLTVEPSLAPDQAEKASIPTISFPSPTNPTAPVFNAGDIIHPFGDFLQPPANSNWTIHQYVWDFGNGKRQTVASSDTGAPTQNVTATYSAPGVYPLSLTLTTGSNGATFSVATVRTVAVQSSTLPFALLTTSSGVQNPGVITVAEVWSGGAYSFDPQVDYQTIPDLEVMVNIFQTLVVYNGSSTVSFIPYLAAALPTRENGGISSDYRTYTFQIRDDQYFSNGDLVTAYDVWFSMARCIAFTGGVFSTADWIQAQFLIPGVESGTADVYTGNTWEAATRSVAYDNATNTVTFHFNRPMAPTLALQILATPWGAGIVDSRYAWSVGAGFNEANWDSYKNQANSGSYNTEMQWSPVGSGPFMIQSHIPGQSVMLVPNPHYGGVPGIPKQTKSVVINWVKTPATALLMLQDGQADSVSGLASSDFPEVQKLQAQGLVNIYDFPSFVLLMYGFNIKIDKELEAAQFGPGFNEPSNYFADLPTRLAWINAYDYKGYLDNILGNAKYGTTFGSGFQGAIPSGMEYFVPPDRLGGLPAQNLDAARGNFSISAWAKQKITVPLIESVGDPVDLAAGIQWAATLAQISNGNIDVKVVQMEPSQFAGNYARDANPMGVYLTLWGPDYPDASDYTFPFYGEGGMYPQGANLGVSNFASLAPSTPYDVVHVNGSTYTQAQVYKWINDNITLAGTSVDPAVRQRAYEITTKLAVAMGLYVYIQQQQGSWYFRTWLKGEETQENPMLTASLRFYWLTKE